MAIGKFTDQEQLLVGVASMSSSSPKAFPFRPTLPVIFCASKTARSWRWLLK
jgi:hypothetical protein